MAGLPPRIRKLMILATLIAALLQGFVINCTDSDGQSVAFAIADHCDPPAGGVASCMGSPASGNTSPCCVDTPLGTAAYHRLTGNRAHEVIATPTVTSLADRDWDVPTAVRILSHVEITHPSVDQMQTIVLLI